MTNEAAISHAIAERRFDDRQARGASDEERTAPAREARERAAEINSPGVIHDRPALPDFRAAPPPYIIHAPPPTRATVHQQRAALLGMHATADQYRQAGRSSDLRRQLAKIATREDQLMRDAIPEMWGTYLRDRDHAQEARDSTRARIRIIEASSSQATRPEPPPAPEPPKAPPARNPNAATTKPPAAQTGPASGLTDLDRAIETLVSAHTCGAVIDAAWSAAHRLFRPNGARP
jgi:hypothetical protein